MEGCLFFFYLVNLIVGYSLDNVEDVPSFADPQWRPSFRQELPDNYYDNYAQAGNADPQDYEYPRMAASMEDPAANPVEAGSNSDNTAPLPATGGGGPTVSNAATPLAQPIAAEPETAHVIPVYTPPKNKHTDKEAEPYIAPEWQSDDGIADVGRDPKIVAALEAITADLIGRGKELTAERKWAKQVDSMLELYKDKVSNVHTHIEQIREEMKTLLKKKRQIENVEVQQQLTSKLRLAQDDLEALDGAMSHVQSKADEFAEKKKKLEKQIETINGHIQKLQHKHGDDAEDSDLSPSENISEKEENNAKKAKTQEESLDEEETGKKEKTEKTNKAGSNHEHQEEEEEETKPKKEEPKKEEPKKEEDLTKEKTKTKTENAKFRDQALEDATVKKKAHNKNSSHLRGPATED